MVLETHPQAAGGDCVTERGVTISSWLSGLNMVSMLL